MPQTANQKPATIHTRKANDALYGELDFSDTADFENARKGFIAPPEGSIKNAEGRVIWDWNEYAFLEQEQAPETVNPSLWRQARLNNIAGLFEVAEGIYQVRGFDISIISFIRSANGWIIVDPITSCETSSAAKNLLFKHIGAAPIKAVIYTHSHADHWAGVKGVISQDEVNSGALRVIAPEGFMNACVSENVLAGNAMTRRGSYMFGAGLPAGVKGHVDCGIGRKIPVGTVSLIAPTHEIKSTGETLLIDGIEIVFQLTPETEAPTEMNLYFPQKRALLVAEICTHALHNIYTIRGTEVRDSKSWAHYIDEAIEKWAVQSDVVFTTHSFPIWGTENGIAYLKHQRDGYKYIHDQALRLANLGHTINEAAELLHYPLELEHDWALRGVYGTVHHNTKAVIQRYLGYYDGNPATLYHLPPEEAGKKYVDLAGGAAQLLASAQKAFDNGEYRWAAQLLNHLVFAEPENEDAKLLEADTLEQLGYQSESAAWRNSFLSAAQELRGFEQLRNIQNNAQFDVVTAMDAEHLFDYLSVSLNAERAAGKKLALHFNFTDIGEEYLLIIENSVLNYWKGKGADGADLSITVAKRVLIETFMGGKLGAVKNLLTGKIKLKGNVKAILEFQKLLDKFTPDFNIVTP
ncbi:MAG: MBL fold metallo-hydrolase [Oscillospiraceae bacterium]|jgi:alkyl sulfatase BDS1-like metallo-beta-lactamase superfamily hydrolase|nr:MBL fold metallo-hydrolase [Oscillospiraceae bacterium]